MDNPYDHVPAGPPTASSTSSSAFHQQPVITPEAYGDVGFDSKQQEDPASVYRRPTDVLRTMADFDRDQHHHASQYPFQEEDEEFWDEEEEDPSRFINFSLLSHIAVQLRDKIPRATHVKGSIPYERAFTGKDIVVRPLSLSLQRDLRVTSTFYSLVHDPISHSARTSYQPWSIDQRSTRRDPSRSKPTEPAVLLRSRMGRPRPPRWCRGRLHVPWRPRDWAS